MSGPSKKATLLSIHSLFICHYTINLLQNTFDELQFYDSFEELTLTFRNYKSLPRRVFASSLIPCRSTANKVIRNFVRTVPDLVGSFIFVKYNFDVDFLMFSRHVRVGPIRIFRLRTVRAEIALTGKKNYHEIMILIFEFF